MERAASDLWRHPFLLVGVVHLLPLPGAPRYSGSFTSVLERARRDAQAYAEAGLHALLVENFGDVPFRKDRVEPHVIAAMALAVQAVRETTGLPVGINVLRNDAQAALGIAAVTGAQFVRVNVHVGVMVTDQGIIEGKADETLRYRAALGAHVELWADVLVKHAAMLAPRSLEELASETIERGLADAVIVTGTATGEAPDPSAAVRVRSRLPSVPLLVGSGVTPQNLRSFVGVADGAIVGTWVKQDGLVHNPVDRRRARQLIETLAELEAVRSKH
ncbi:MAG: BtpA/SgcQ family protein [Thermomicrobium sp.]|nr:BtpA/SgcQ family protein [Thermomicrobium sp.]